MKPHVADSHDLIRVHGARANNLMAHADWIIDLGPGAGHDGGKVVFEGTPADLVAGWERIGSLTGEHLAEYVT